MLIEQGTPDRDFLVRPAGELEIRRRYVSLGNTEELEVGRLFAGEGALLLGGFRNAAVTLTTPARLLTLSLASPGPAICRLTSCARSAELDPGRPYIVYCRSGRRSAAAAFLLHERGFKANSLTGGVRATGRTHSKADRLSLP